MEIPPIVVIIYINLDFYAVIIMLQVESHSEEGIGGCVMPPRGVKKTKPVSKLRDKSRVPRVVTTSQKMLSVKAIEKVERRYKVLCLRRDGYSLIEIGQELGISHETASEDLKAILLDTMNRTELTTDEERRLQADRLDSLVKANMPFATKEHKEVRTTLLGEEVIVTVPPDPKFANVVLAAEARRARLLALDKPEAKGENETGMRVYIGVDYSQI